MRVKKNAIEIGKSIKNDNKTRNKKKKTRKKENQKS